MASDQRDNLAGQQRQGAANSVSRQRREGNGHERNRGRCLQQAFDVEASGQRVLACLEFGKAKLPLHVGRGCLHLSPTPEPIFHAKHSQLDM